MFGADKASFVKKRKATLQDYINGLIGIKKKKTKQLLGTRGSTLLPI